MRKFAQIIAAAAVAAASTSAFAGQKQDGFDVKVKITGTCSVTAADFDFGTLTQVLGTETTTAKVGVKCSKTLAYSLAFDTATASMSGAAVGNTDTIPYSLNFETKTQLDGSGNPVLDGSGNPITYLHTSGVGLGMSAADIEHTVTAALTAASSPQPDDYKQARIVYVNY